MLYLQEPGKCLAEVIKLINFLKSLIMPLTGQNQQFSPFVMNAGILQLKTPFPIPTGNIKYLGINISTKLSELFHLNFAPIIKTINVLNC